MYRCASVFIGGSLLPLSSVALSANVASQVVSYDHGGTASDGFQDSNAALGSLNPIADPVFGNTILSPFNPPYRNSDIVIVGDGGQLTLKLQQSVSASATGPEIGVFVNNGLIDIEYPHGQNRTPAGFFSDLPQAIVSVSANGSDFVPLNASPFVFDVPSNYYADLGADPSNTSTPGSIAADMGKPFSGHLNDFSGLDWNGTKALLAGSAGGTWLDFSATGLPAVQYVRFAVPAGANYRMVVDAVSAVPEPTCALLALSLAALLRRRRA
jgi:uncharacterized protein (TIGR03382 family)